MQSSLPAPTPAELRRFEILKFWVGCINHPGTPAEAHHLLDRGRRISHRATVALCPECHYEIANTPRAFYEEYETSDAELLAETDRRVADFELKTIGGPRYEFKTA